MSQLLRTRVDGLLKGDVRGYGNYDVVAASRSNGLVFLDESLTVQSEKEDADINVLVRRFGLTGTMPQGVRIPMYGDFTEIGDYKSALDAVREAEESFLSMPAETRAKFQNDPQKFLDFCADEKNLPEMRKMGLAVPESVIPAPQKVQVVGADGNPISLGISEPTKPKAE